MKKTIFGLTAAFFVTAASANTPIPDVSPVSEGQHVVINIPQQRLFLYTDGKLTKIYPVAVGKAMTQTTLGEHKIGAKAFNPTWHIPKSIQKERGDGVKSVPAGPNNPLGPVFVRLGDPKLGLGIHGTNAPASVPGVRSHGCVRMKSPDALEFAKTIASGAPPPLDRANLPRWVWCFLTWSMAAASLALVSYSELALLGFFIVLPMIWWVYTKWWTAVVGHLIFGAGFAAAGYLRGDEAWWVNSIIMVVVVLVTGTWVTWVHIVRYEAIHALADIVGNELAGWKTLEAEQGRRKG